MNDLINQKQAEYNELNKVYIQAADMADRCRENGMNDTAETYDEQADELWKQLLSLEDWLIDHNAPGWVST